MQPRIQETTANWNRKNYTNFTANLRAHIPKQYNSKIINQCIIASVNTIKAHEVPVPRQETQRGGWCRWCLKCHWLWWRSFWIHQRLWCVLAANSMIWSDRLLLRSRRPLWCSRRTPEPPQWEESKRQAIQANLYFQAMREWKAIIQFVI